MANSATGNPDQARVIGTITGPLLVVAGPGSGKTFCLVERTAHILETTGVDPSRVLISTFTEKAAKELTTRITNRLSRSDSYGSPLDLTVGTLHSIFLQLLDEFRAHTSIQRNYTVLDRFDQQYFIFQQLSEFRAIDGLRDLLTGGASRSAWSFSGTLAGWINKVSEAGIRGEGLREAEVEDLKTLGEAYGEYGRLLAQFNYLDFSTIQVEMLKLLENDTICSEIQGPLRLPDDR